MKTIYFFLALFLVSLTQQHSAAGYGSPLVDDNDLAWPTTLTDEQIRIRKANNTITPDAIEISPATPNEVSWTIQYQRNNQWMGVPNLEFTEAKKGSSVRTDETGSAIFPCSEQVEVSASFADSYFNIKGDAGTYQLPLQLQCGSHYLIQFQEASENGQAISLFETFQRVETRLQETVGLNFWKRKINLVWPGKGDYYSFGTVNITNGHHWDIVGHEIGHAIYDQARLGGFGGGQHKIDECYSGALALSEGWATYFSGWIYLDLADTDAKFQYLVPRRAPIQIENVPSDVCSGTTNEWRVSSFFWDLVDSNVDNETANETFARVWLALAGKMPKDISRAAELLLDAKMDGRYVDAAWEQNFLGKRP